MADLLDRDTEEMLDKVRQHYYRERQAHKEVEDAMKHRLATERLAREKAEATVERLWAVADRYAEEGLLAIGKAEREARDIDALCKVMGVEES